jgi:hypothetical protein
MYVNNCEVLTKITLRLTLTLPRRDEQTRISPGSEAAAIAESRVCDVTDELRRHQRTCVCSRGGFEKCGHGIGCWRIS